MGCHCNNKKCALSVKPFDLDALKKTVLQDVDNEANRQTVCCCGGRRLCLREAVSETLVGVEFGSDEDEQAFKRDEATQNNMVSLI